MNEKPPNYKFNSISPYRLFIWEQEGIRTEFHIKVHDPYPEHNGEQT